MFADYSIIQALNLTVLSPVSTYLISKLTHVPCNIFKNACLLLTEMILSMLTQHLAIAKSIEPNVVEANPQDCLAQIFSFLSFKTYLCVEKSPINAKLLICHAALALPPPLLPHPSTR
jgi:hypothetical protein